MEKSGLNNMEKSERRKMIEILAFTKAIDNLNGSLFYKLHPYWRVE